MEDKVSIPEQALAVIEQSLSLDDLPFHKPKFMLYELKKSNRAATLYGRAKKKHFKALKRAARKPNLERIAEEKEFESYLLKSGWTKGKESWYKPNWEVTPRSGEGNYKPRPRPGDGYSYQTLRSAARIQRKLDWLESSQPIAEDYAASHSSTGPAEQS